MMLHNDVFASLLNFPTNNAFILDLLTILTISKHLLRLATLSRSSSLIKHKENIDQSRTNGPINAHLTIAQV